MLLAVLERFDFRTDVLMEALSQHKYDQLVKSKKKEARVELIKRHDFLEVIKVNTGIDLVELGDGVLVDVLS